MAVTMKHVLIAALLVAPGASMAKADSVADFYKGRTVSIIVGFGPGGGYDLYGRVLGRHLGRHIPGRPAVTVQNMEGAGSVRAANYVFASAPADGTVIAAVDQNGPMYQLLGGAGAQFEVARMQWVGSIANSNGVVYTWHMSGINTIEDAKAREVPLGSPGTTSDSFIYPTIINGLLGTKFKPISGYTGTGQINIAIERGEVQGRGGISWVSLKAGSQAWLEGRKINLLVQIGPRKEPDLPDVPLLGDLVQSAQEKQIVELITLPTVLGHAHWVAPNVPAERIAALRAAYAATLADPEFLDETKRLNMETRPQTGAQVDALVKAVAATPKPIVDKTARILGWRN
jgi:tripartite-type tricarboxylate transporter receptor subunit TctC